jgi:hypothetical protein
LELFAPCVRPRARSPCSRRLRRRNTPAQKIVLEQVFFTNRSLEASWVNSVRSSPRRVVVSAPFKKKTSAPVGQKWKIDAFVAFERHLRWIRGEGARGDERAASPRLRLPRARRRLRRAVGSKFMLSNRQKAGKGFGRTGAACVVVTPRERGGGGGSEARKANAAGIEKRGGGFAGRGGRCHASAARTARIASRDPGVTRPSPVVHGARAARREAARAQFCETEGVRERAFLCALSKDSGEAKKRRRTRTSVAKRG